MINLDKILVMGEEDFLVGFKLAGVKDVVLCNSLNAEEELWKALDRKDVGIIIYSDDLKPSSFSPKLKRALDNTSKPVVVSVIGRKGGVVSESASIAAMVKRAIGIELKN